MYIYLLSDGVKYKLGKSKNPERRIKELQTGNSNTIFLLNKYHSPKYFSKIESALHNTYFNIREIGEWFDLSNEQALSFIEICRKIEKNLLFLENNKI